MSFVDTIFGFVQNNLLISLCVFAVLLRLFLFKPQTGEFEEYPGNKVISIHSPEEWAEAITKSSREKKLVVVDFYALWCPPCRYAAPTYGKMSTEYEDVTFLKVDVDKLGNVAADNSVRAMPTFVIYKRGAKIDHMTGFSESNLRNLIEKHR